LRIYKNQTKQEAVLFPYKDGAPARYRVFPAYRYSVNGSRRNTLQDEVAFEKIEHAAEFLVRHPGSAIRMMPGRAIVWQDIVVDIDAEEPEPTEEFPDESDREESE